VTLRCSLTVALTCLAALLPGCASSPTRPEPGRPVAVDLLALPFNGDDPADRGTPTLRVVSVYEVQADRPEFGGFSGLVLEHGILTAVSDHGFWWRSRLELDPAGILIALRDNRIGPLHDVNGKPVVGRDRRDAEEIARWPGGYLVSFEGQHRISLYRKTPEGRRRGWPAITDRRPLRVATPYALAEADTNGGLEAMTRLADGRLLLFSEEQRTAEGEYLAWVGTPNTGAWQELKVLGTEDFKSTAAATLPGGDVLLVQRSYSPERGPRIRVCRIPVARLAPEAPAGTILPEELILLEAPRAVDNIESVDVLPAADGRIFVFLLADENYSETQTTVLLQFELLPSDPAATPAAAR
jgi:hypothetical protein